MPVPGKFNSHLIIFTVLLAAALTTSACAPSNGNPTPVLSSTATATASVPAVTRTLLPNPTATGTPFPTPTSAPTDQPIGVANATDLRLIRTAGDGSLGALALSPDGRILAAAGSRGFWLFDKFTLELIARGAPEIGAITRVAWSPDGLRIATGGQDGAVRIWEMLHDPENGRVILDQVALLAGHAAEVRALAWSPDGARIASGGDDETIRVWNTATFRNSLIQAHTSAVYALDWHPGSELILIGEFDGSISVTNGVTGENYASFLAQDGWINAVRWSPDGARAVSGGLDRTLRIWELTPAFALKELGIYGTLYAISTIAWSTDGEYIALAGGTPYTIELINPATANETNRSLSSEGVFSGHSGPISGLVFAPGGVLFSSGQDNTLRAWNLATRQELRRLSSGPAAAFTSGLNVVDWSPDGIQAATGGADGTLHIWDVSTGETTRLISAHNGIITSLDWSPGGNWIVTGGSDNFSRLWDAQTGELLQELRSEGGQVNAVALSPFNNFIASGGFFRIGQIWQAGTDRAPTLIYPDVEITALGWASSGTLLALGGNDGTVRLYNGQTGADLGILSKEQNTNIVAVAWEPLGGRIAAMDRRGTIVIWESSSGEVLAKHTGDGRIWSGLSWAPNGVLATGSEDGVIKLFDTATLVPLSIHAVHSAAVNDLAFSPRGSRLLSAGSDGALITLGIEYGAVLDKAFTIPERGRRGSLPVVSWPPSGPITPDNAENVSALAVIGRGTVLTYAANSRYLAVGGGNGVWIYQRDDGSFVRYLDGGRTFGLAWSPDGRFLAARELQQVVIWEVDTVEIRHIIPAGLGVRDALAWTPDASLFAAADRQGQVSLYSIASGNKLAGWASAAEVRDLVFSPDGQRLAAGTGAEITIYDVPSGDQIALLKGHSDIVSHIRFHPTEPLLISSGDDRTIRLWDLESITQPPEVPEGEEVIWPEVSSDSISTEAQGAAVGLAWTPDGSMFLSAHGPDIVVEWGTATRQIQQTIHSENGEIVLLDDGEITRALSAADDHFSEQTALTWQSTGSVVFLGTENRLDEIVLPTLEKGYTFSDVNENGPVLDIVAGAPVIALRQERGRTLYLVLYDPATELFIERAMPEGLADEQSGNWIAAISPDAKTLAWNNTKNIPQTIDFMDLEAKEHRTFVEIPVESEEDSSLFTFLAWSPDGTRLAGGAEDGRMFVWNATNGVPSLVLPIFEQRVNALAWSHDGRLLAVAGSDGNANGGFQVVRLVQVSSGRVLFELALDFAHTAVTLEFSPDSLLLASGDSSGDVLLWDVSSGIRVAELFGHKLSITSIAFSDDSMALATSSRDGTVRVWGVNNTAIP